MYDMSAVKTASDKLKKNNKRALRLLHKDKSISYTEL